MSTHRHDPQVAKHNVSIGLAAVAARFESLSAKAPEIVQGELLEMPVIALALVYAAGRVPSTYVASKGEIAARLREITEPRELGVSFLRIVSRLEDPPVPPARVARLGEEKGPLGIARDAVQVVGIFKEFAALLAGKHPFSAAFLNKLGADAAWLLAALTPGNVHKRAAARSPEAIERDQIAKLLEQRHEQLRTAGVMLFGLRALDDKVPPLYSASRAASADEGSDDEDPPAQ